MRQIVIDTETTGLTVTSGDRIIEIGCIELVNRRLTGARFHRYINPLRDIEPGAIEVTGLTNEFLQDKPEFHAIAREFFNFIKGAELIAHNAPFDVGFINHEFKLCEFETQDIAEFCPVFDTLTLARRLHPGQRNSLDALCKRYHVEHFNRDLHGALLDAEILAQVYLAMTGGQTMLFTESFGEAKSEGKAQVKPKKIRSALRVIHATSDELAAHEQFMKILKEEKE